MKVSCSQLEDLEFQLVDFLHDYGQEILTGALERFYKWANSVCPGFADDWGVCDAK